VTVTVTVIVIVILTVTVTVTVREGSLPRSKDRSSDVGRVCVERTCAWLYHVCVCLHAYIEHRMQMHTVVHTS
jgi:hypothetical protein